MERVLVEESAIRMSIDPHVRHTLLSGWAAYRYSRITLVLFGAVFLSTILAIASGTIPAIASSDPNAAPVAIGVDVVVVLVTAIFMAISTIKVRLELAAGYTTALGLNQNVDLVEPRSGIVIRKAGEQMLTKSQYRDACRCALRKDAEPK
jgi:hypothetical protein